MKPVNRLLTLLSLTTIVITVERFSPTTKVLLQPYSFLRLHEAVQMTAITAASVIISLLLLRAVSANFQSLQDMRGTLLAAVFVLGTYYYGTGNGAHEVASFLFNQFCDTKHFTSTACGSMYFNDYYFGNVVYFVGLGLSNLSLVLLEMRRPDESFGGRDIRITLANALVLALTFIAYDAYDRVSVGLISTIIYAVVFAGLLLSRREEYRSLPFTLYSAVGFSLATVIAIPLRVATS